ncbi:MAG: hypothetical protein PHQ95_01430 [Candidatus Gracilibacteria bacterium]|nr:hypothetical protein [Candidatus Gracilibacteria bacterium]
MSIHKPDWCTDKLSIKSGLIREPGVEKSNWGVLQLRTTSGLYYHTSLTDERSFRFLVQQVKDDKLTEIRYSDHFMQEWLMNSENVGDWIKSRVRQSLKSL